MTACRLPWLTALLLATCCALAAIAPLSNGSAAQPSAGLFWTLVLSADEPLAPWRWLGAHLLHTDIQHLAWNALALLVLGTLIEQSPGGRRRLVAGFLAGALAVTLWFHELAESRFYCGLSGVLNTLFVIALATVHRTAQSGEKRRRPHAVLTVLLLGAFAKAGYELWLGAPLLMEQQWPAAPGAHLVGLLAGVMLVLAGRTKLTDR